MHAVHGTRGLAADAVDDTDGLRDVVDVLHEEPDRNKHQGEGHRYGDPRYKPVHGAVLPSNVAQDEERKKKGGQEHAESRLVAAILEELAQNTRRELPAGQLQDDHGDREHQGRESEHR